MGRTSAEFAQIGVHPIWLSFRESERERSFQDDYFHSNLSHGRLCHVVAALFFVGYGLMEWYFVPRIGAWLFVPRVAVASLWGLGLMLSYVWLPLYRRIWQPLFGFYVLWAGFGHLLMMRAIGPEATPFILPGIALTLFFGFAFIRLRFVYAVASGFIVILAYPLTTVGWASVDRTLVTSGFTYLLGLGALGAIIAHRLEYLVRRDFNRHHDLAAAQRALQASKDSLEAVVAERTRELAATNRDLERKIRDVEESRERERLLEAQLGQARKLEAIGHLAGGVAHDFNNLLTVITANSELVLDTVEGDPGLRADVEVILNAARRAAGLTGQLLAFSRKQVLQPEVLDLNEAVEDVGKMLRRLLPEDIRVDFSLGQGLSPVFVDRTQLNQVILNLAVNARDAMPGGGILTVETRMVELDDTYVRSHAEATVGPHVMILMSDTGVGMDRETLSRAFDPFFTTKSTGRGTGLGLSTVFGIVKQSGGNIWAYSEPERGTTLKIYLPPAPAPADDGRPPRPPAAVVRGGGETILLVEDDAEVRASMGKALGSLGYQVTAVGSGVEGMAYADEPGADVDLLVTDVVMPGMSGPELASRLTEARPGLRVLFVSGYTANAMAQKGILEPGVHLLDKPFTLEALAAKVREALTSPPSSG